MTYSLANGITRQRLLVSAWLMSALLCTLSPGTLRADDLNPKHIPADANWIIHVDYEGLSQSAIWNKLKGENKDMAQNMKNWVSDRYGIDLPDDLKGFTVFGTDYEPHTGTAIIQAAYDRSKIEELLKQSSDHGEKQWQDVTFHSFTVAEPKESGPTKGTTQKETPKKDTATDNKDKQMWLVCFDDDTIVLSSGEKQAQRAVDLLSSGGQSLDGTQSPLLSDHAKSAWIYAAAINLADLEQHPVAMPIITQHQRIQWSFGKQDDGSLYEQGEFVAQSEDVAKKMAKVLEGLIAYQTLWAGDNKSLSQLVQNADVTQEGETASFQWSGSSDEVLSALDHVLSRLKEWKSDKKA